MSTQLNFESLGRIIIGVVDQDKVWRTAEGIVYRIEEMEPRHQRNVIQYLRRRFSSGNMEFLYGIHEIRMECRGYSDNGGNLDHARDEWLDHQQEMRDENPYWIDDTPLMKRLLELHPDLAGAKAWPAGFPKRRPKKHLSECLSVLYGNRAGFRYPCTCGDYAPDAES